MKKNQSGQSLVSVIIAAGVGAIVLGFLTDTMIQQGIGQKFLTQKLEINDLTNNLITAFSKADNCSCQFADDPVTNPNHGNYATHLKFNSTLPIGQRKISVKKLYTGCKSATFTPPVLVEDDAFVPNSSSNLKVDTVELVNLQQVGATNEWQGQWQISFQTGTGKVIRSVRPIHVTQKVTISTTTPNSTTAAVITGCTGISSGSGTENYLAKWSDTLGVLENSAVFEAAGKVGIGTSTPNYPVTISSNNSLTSRAEIAINGFENGSGIINTGYRGFTARGSRSAPTALLAGDSLTSLGASGYWTGKANPFFELGDGRAFFKMIAAEDWTAATNNGTAMLFSTTQNGTKIPAEKVRIDHNGNVGIGTSTPAWGLHVNGGINGSQIGIDNGSGAAVFSQVNFLSSGVAQSFIGHDTTNNLLVIGGQNLNVGFDSVRFRPLGGGVGNDVMTIKRTGNIGIGVTNPVYQLQLSTDSAAKPGSQTWAIASDERLKDIRVPFTRGLEALINLHAIYFSYKKDNPLGLPSDKEFVGIKAQDALAAIPEAVSRDVQGYLHITGDSIIWTAVNAIKELYQRFLDHDHEIASLKAENAELKARLLRIETALLKNSVAR